MKPAAPIALLACALALAGPASAGIPLSKAVKLCKAELAKQTPPPKAAYVDNDDTALSDTHLWIAFKVRSAEDRMEKLTCKVDNAGTAVEIKPR